MSRDRNTMTKTTVLRGLSEVANDYDTFIVDLWGVMHDGVAAFPEAVDCLGRLKSMGGCNIILSNAPRRASEVASRNSELGISPTLVDLVMSSGEATWRHLSRRPDPWYRALGGRCFHLGPERDLGMRDGLEIRFVETLGDADFILLTGAVGFEDKVADYDALLAEALSRALPMVCANPDREVIRGGRREICAGAIALAYEERGGEVRYHGKPDSEIYDECLTALGIVDRRRVLALGDSLRTDIAGAVRAGIDALFVAGGIHADELGLTQGGTLDGRQLDALIAAAPEKPLAALPHLVW
jgi:HAD superfamily hydrolase (TIGR01459 family)